MKSGKIVERVHFRLVNTKCCGTLICLVNPRFPNYCPECGKHCYPQIKGWVNAEDDEALITYKGVV